MLFIDARNLINSKFVTYTVTESHNHSDFFKSLRTPVILVASMWVIKMIEYLIDKPLFFLGIHPRETSTLLHVFTAPLIHGDFVHLGSNSIPLIVCGMLVFYFYPTISSIVLSALWILTGILVWLFAGDGFHIGASGIVYGLCFFLFMGGLFRKDVTSLAVSMAILVLYGGIFEGILPNKPGVSWESHLAGSVIGSFLALLFRNKDKPVQIMRDWEDEPLVNEFRYRDDDKSQR